MLHVAWDLVCILLEYVLCDSEYSINAVMLTCCLVINDVLGA